MNNLGKTIMKSWREKFDIKKSDEDIAKELKEQKERELLDRQRSHQNSWVWAINGVHSALKRIRKLAIQLAGTGGVNSTGHPMLDLEIAVIYRNRLASYVDELNNQFKELRELEKTWPKMEEAQIPENSCGSEIEEDAEDCRLDTRGDERYVFPHKKAPKKDKRQVMSKKKRQKVL